jgi:hypothetical protein
MMVMLMMNILTSASHLCFLLFLFIYSSPSISCSFSHYTLIVIIIIITIMVQLIEASEAYAEYLIAKYFCDSITTLMHTREQQGRKYRSSNSNNTTKTTEDGQHTKGLEACVDLDVDLSQVYVSSATLRVLQKAFQLLVLTSIQKHSGDYYRLGKGSVHVHFSYYSDDDDGGGDSDDDDEYTNLCNLCFLLFLFIYSSLSISWPFLHYTLIVINSLGCIESSLQHEHMLCSIGELCECISIHR